MAKLFTFLSLTFVICKMGMILIEAVHKVLERFNEITCFTQGLNRMHNQYTAPGLDQADKGLARQSEAE